MLKNEDQQLMKQLMTEREDFRSIITKMQENHHFTVSKISHEIGNPLTLIYSSLQLIESCHPEVREFKHWSETIDDLKSLKLLLQDLSSYNHSSNINISSVDLSALLKDLDNSFASYIAASPKELHLHISDGIPTITGDPLKIKQVLSNLIHNALDAITRYGTVSVTLAVDNPFVTIIVADDGCGIPADDIEGIFEPFVTHKPTGTGLGLAICKEIMEAHNGSISVSSVPGQGTVFTLRFPVSPDDTSTMQS